MVSVCKSSSPIISSNNWSSHSNISIEDDPTNIPFNPTSQCHPACFNSEISTCCLTMFARSRRCSCRVASSSTFYNGFFIKNLHYNNNPYKTTKNEFFDAIWNKADAAARIKLYDPIFFWEYVYIVYFSKIKGGWSKLICFQKQKTWRYI